MGGTSIGRWYRDVPRSWPPFFRKVGAPYIAYQFTINMPLMCPIFNFQKKLVLAEISALTTEICIFFFQRPLTLIQGTSIP